MNRIHNSNVQKNVNFLPLNLTSILSLETQSQSLLCFLPMEYWGFTESQGVDVVGVTWLPGSSLHTDVCWGIHLPSVVDPHRLQVTSFLSVQTWGTFRPHPLPAVSMLPWRCTGSREAIYSPSSHIPSEGPLGQSAFLICHFVLRSSLGLARY